MKIPKKKKIPTKNTKEKPKTFTYLMKDERSGFIKIGRSSNPRVREKTLQSENPLCFIIFKFKSNFDTESRVQEHFKSFRVRGEWFKLNSKQIREAKSLIKEFSK